MDIFQNSPLDHSRRQIRILRPLQPSAVSQSEAPSLEGSSPTSIIVRPDLTLNFEFVVVSLDDNPVFTALSYVWGDDGARSAFISVDGKRFGITTNLDIGLRHLQHRDIAPCVWIDSICINQRDVDEKAVQVRIMNLIYSKADKVHVWLGPAQTHSDLIASVIHEFANQIRQHCNVPVPQKYALLDYFDFETESEVNSLLERAMMSAGINDQTSVKDFPNVFLACVIELPWWYRVWIIQEYVLARKVVFQIGKCKIQQEELSAIMLVFFVFTLASILTQSRISNSGHSIGVAGFDWIGSLLTYPDRHIRNRPGDRNLYELLVSTYARAAWPKTVPSLGATQKSDYIFGLVGLAEEHFDQLGLEVNYSRRWEDTYTDVAKALITAGYMDLFAFCQNPTPNDSYNLPSWVPNWQARIQVPNGWFKTAPAGRHTLLGHSLFSASGSSAQVQVQFKNHYIGEHTVRSVILTGVFVDTVLEAKTVYAKSTATRSREREVLYGNLFREITSLCAKSTERTRGLYHSSILSEAVWRMPIWDHEPRDDGLDGDQVIRATHKSRDRWHNCLHLFKATESYLLAEDLSRQMTVMTHLQFVVRWIRIALYRAISKYHLLRYNIPSMNHMWHYIKKPSRLWKQVDLLENDPTMDENVYLLAMEGGRPTRTFLTQRGYIGMGPAMIEPGDVVYICFGARVPHILRQRRDAGYEFVGESYVHGIMDGEFLHESRDPTEFEIF